MHFNIKNYLKSTHNQTVKKLLLDFKSVKGAH